jgi:hypothetical protein
MLTIGTNSQDFGKAVESFNRITCQPDGFGRWKICQTHARLAMLYWSFSSVPPFLPVPAAHTSDTNTHSGNDSALVAILGTLLMVVPDSTIDIPSARLVDWLVCHRLLLGQHAKPARLPNLNSFVGLVQVERQFLKAKWRSRCKALQLKVAELKNQLPKDMQSGEASHQNSKLVRDMLISSADKNFLGYYKGKAGVWDKIVRAYESESESTVGSPHLLSTIRIQQMIPQVQFTLRSCLTGTRRCILSGLGQVTDIHTDLNVCVADIHIGEAAFTLSRNVDFEILYLRAQMLKHQQQLMDHEKKQADYLKSAANAQTQYAQVVLSRWRRKSI